MVAARVPACVGVAASALLVPVFLLGLLLGRVSQLIGRVFFSSIESVATVSTF